MREARQTLSRRQLLVGTAFAAVGGVSVARSLAAPPQGGARAARSRSQVTSPRFMGAAAVLPDGRILVTGGYDRPWKDIRPSALNSAQIFDPSTGKWESAAPMNLPRARHAAVSLSDGRVSVIGGINLNATSSVEIYDPRRDTWESGPPLAQPRYDHTSVALNGQVFVFGGSGQGMLASTEILHLD